MTKLGEWIGKKLGYVPEETRRPITVVVNDADSVIVRPTINILNSPGATAYGSDISILVDQTSNGNDRTLPSSDAPDPRFNGALTYTEGQRYDELIDQRYGVGDWNGDGEINALNWSLQDKNLFKIGNANLIDE